MTSTMHPVVFEEKPSVIVTPTVPVEEQQKSEQKEVVSQEVTHEETVLSNMLKRRKK